MVRLIILFVLNFLAFTKLAAQDSLQLVLNEEFNDTELNRQLWNTRYSWGRTISSNHELEYYTDTGNIELQADKLLLIAKREPITAKIDSAMADDFFFEGNRMNLSSFGYTSGMLCSKQQFMYGKFEIRCRLPADKVCGPPFGYMAGGRLMKLI
jgi:beta-glucanase (GH16 family)